MIQFLPLRVAGAAAASLLCFAATAQAVYPSKPIRMIVPLAAGSAVDVAARIVAQKMSASMGQSIVIENLPGAAGLSGADRVAKAAPDGYTIGGFNDSIMTMVPALQAKMPWDIVRDFAPVSLVATIEWGLVANPTSTYSDAAGLIAAAKAAPGRIDYGSGRQGAGRRQRARTTQRAGIEPARLERRRAGQRDENPARQVRGADQGRRHQGRLGPVSAIGGLA